MPRTIAIGDIHGCRAALETLLAKLEPQPEDRLVFLGDYIDRGPDSRGVIETLMRLKEKTRVVTILGNHEEMLLAARDNVDALEYWLDYGGDATLRSYGVGMKVDRIPQEHVDFLSQCVEFFETPTHLFLHANYVEDLPLERQPAHALRWESLFARTPGTHMSGKRAVLGHTRQTTGEALDLPQLTCIDTFCCGGMWLTALEPATGRIWQANDAGQMRE